ncbi:testis-specific gene 10 protein isoform X1 [Salminus brasiliensis]|uniref:testis-specific gene 10 protein isoform X1 n=1 Tax=Salminus brasiliensis TaxID=930266 RepID=UPI003B834D77
MKSMLRSRRSGSPTRANSTSRSPTRQTPVKGGTYDSELMRVLRERDELQNMLDKYERHLSEVQANIRVLTADRDKTRMHYQQAQEEIADLRRMVMKSKTSRGPKSSVTAQSILKRVEAERDEAVTDLHRMTTERDSLRERLKISQETAISERAHLEQRVEDLQNAVLTLEQERGEQKSRQSQMREAMMGLEEEVHTLGRKLTTSEDELGRLKNECTMLRLSSTHAESALSETQRRLTSRLGELQTAQERNKQLDERNDVLLQEITGLKEELSALQATVSELDQNKHSLQEQLERKNDLLCSTNKQLDDKENTIHTLKIHIEDLETTIQAAKEIGVSRERDLDVLRRKLLDSGDEIASVLKVKDAMQRENTQLREELDRTRLDNQSLQLKLDEEVHEVEDLQRKVENYVTDIARIEDMLSSKERECKELQECRRRVCVQSENWEDQARQAESNVSELQLQLRTSDSEKRRLKDRVESLESSLQESLSAERSCSTDLSQLKEELRRAQDERSDTHRDLEKTRELCVKLDTSKEVIHQELEACRSELELLRKQLVSERASTRSLEAMLTSTREKELQRHLSSQERLTEIQLLRDKLTMADSKASTQSREVAQLRTRSAQLETELEATRRQLSTERFERERAAQELRRLGLSSSLRSPLLSSTLCSSSPSRHSLSPHRSWSPERSIHTSPDHLPPERSPERSVMFREYD